MSNHENIKKYIREEYCIINGDGKNIMNNRLLEVIKMSTFIDDISFDDKLVEIGIDSLKLAETIINIEDAFNVQFDDSLLDIRTLVTVKDLYNLLNNCM